MTVYNTSKLMLELLDAALPIDSVNSDGDITWTTTPTSQQETDAANILAAHNPINQILADLLESIDGFNAAQKAKTWRDFFYDNRNTDFSTMDTATQDTVIKRLMFIAIYVLDDFMARYDAFYEDPP